MIDENIYSELVFKAVRSGGKGGQNVNKVSTKVELYFDIPRSMILTDGEKQTVLSKLINKIDKNGVLKISSQSERSQHLNKEIAIKKFDEIITKALKKQKKRFKTKRTALSNVERLTKKKIVSEKKSFRMKKNFEAD